MNETRQQILKTAAELFDERGYELVGINEIIEKSGVAKATFYGNFKSKEKLCAEWLRAEAAESEEASRTLLREKLTGLEKLTRKFDLLKTHVLASNFRGCPFSITASMLEPSSEVREVIRDYKASARAFWQSLALEFRADPAEARALGDTWFLLYSGAVTEAQNARSTWPVEAAKQTSVSMAQN
jgi:AcrR family transcriptional regulator